MKHRKLLMIPGPIEFTPEVMRAMGMPTTSHVAPDFVDCMGQAIERTREVFLCPGGQPFIVAGSGTMAMDMAACNIIEPGDNVLVVNTGYFSDRFGAILERYGARVTHVKAAIGDVPSLDEVEAELRKTDYKVLTVTHVDTSTAVLADVKGLAGLCRKYGILCIVDGVCSVAGEELRQGEWGVDIVLTACQKALGVPPGLALLVASPKAIETFKNRRTPVGSYYSDWANWLPIMESYEDRKAAYFGTQAVNLVWALNISLGQILDEGMDKRFARHRLMSDAFKAAMSAIGMKQIPVSADKAANTLTAPYFPAGVDGSVLPLVGEAGVILAGGLLAEIKAKYFRVGHMGVVSASDILSTVGAIESGFAKAGYKFDHGAGLAAAQTVLLR
ncbi:MAG: alanine--glyoxylate aminotransferase family protein [Syntrophobacterales bacterium]|nr:alanine--glyoxylate aminotransferase family protein [Syntrophobacterales bacterium]